MINDTIKMVTIGLDEVVVNRFELSVALERLDIIRMVLYKELTDTRIMDRGTDSIQEWHQRNNDENAYGGWPTRDKNLLDAFEQAWEVSQYLAEKSLNSVLTLDELKEKHN